jgi:outer membrane murein-binding lipoprotein Lpp
MTDNANDKSEQTTPTDTAPVNSGNDGGQPNPQDAASKEVQERIKRAQRIAREKVLKDLGFEDLDKAKAALAKAREVEEGQLTEAQKLQAQVEKLSNDLKTATDRAAQAETERLKDRLDGVIASEARDAKAQHPDDVIDWIRTKSGEDLSKLVGEDGKVDAAAIKALVEKAKTARPTWFNTGGPGSPSNKGGKVPEPNADAKKQAAQDLRRSIKRMT